MEFVGERELPAYSTHVFEANEKFVIFRKREPPLKTTLELVDVCAINEKPVEFELRSFVEDSSPLRMFVSFNDPKLYVFLRDTNNPPSDCYVQNLRTGHQSIRSLFVRIGPPEIRNRWREDRVSSTLFLLPYYCAFRWFT
jgi:hypothetical protein